MSLSLRDSLWLCGISPGSEFSDFGLFGIWDVWIRDKPEKEVRESRERGRCVSMVWGRSVLSGLLQQSLRWCWRRLSRGNESFARVEDSRKLVDWRRVGSS